MGWVIIIGFGGVGFWEGVVFGDFKGKSFFFLRVGFKCCLFLIVFFDGKGFCFFKSLVCVY